MKRVSAKFKLKLLNFEHKMRQREVSQDPINKVKNDA